MTDPALESSFNEDKILSLESELNSLKLNQQILESEKQQLSSDNQDLSLRLSILQSELEHRDQHIKMLNHSIYGKKSEKTASVLEQMSFAFDEAGAFADDTANDLTSEEGDKDTNDEFEEITYKRKKNAGRKPLPENLPREDIIHDLPEEEKICDCGCELTKIGEDTSEELHLVPAILSVKRHIRYKYACKKGCGDIVKRASRPFRPLDKAMVTSSLLSDMLVKKFEDHLPLYRQSRIWERKGVALSRSTLSNWVLKCGDKLEPLIKLLKEDILASGYVCSDETTVNVLEDNKSTNYMWLHMSGGRDKRAVIYTYDSSRSKDAAAKFLSGYQGYHQCDGYSGYLDLHQQDGVVGVGCMAHARRKFMDVVKLTKNKGVAHKAASLMNDLYKLEKKIHDCSAEEKKQRREKDATAILDKLHKLLLEHKDTAPPKGNLAKAINYSLNHWIKLTAYLQDGRIRIDNNDAERAIRPFAIGRKNWMFFDKKKGAIAGCVIFSLIETCKANGVNTFNYLRFILDNIHNAENDEQLRAMLPYNLDPALLKP